MYKILLSLLFLLDAETAHKFTLKTLKFILKIPYNKTIFKKYFEVKNPKLEKKLFGLNFPNIVGLAAGFDKNAEYIDELACLGFGFIEIGTVTPLAQKGNAKPRLFRLKKDKAIINRMGFNNDGADAIVERLKKRKSDIIIGGNIGKNKITPNEKAVEDYKSGKYTIDTKRTYEKSTDFQLEFYYLLASTQGEVQGCYYYDLEHATLKEELLLHEKIEVLRHHLNYLKNEKFFILFKLVTVFLK